MKNYITPIFGAMKLEEIKQAHIVKFHNDLRKTGMRKDSRGDLLTGRTIQYISAVLRNVLNHAVECGLIKVSPMNGVKKPISEKQSPSITNLMKCKKLSISCTKNREAGG